MSNHCFLLPLSEFEALGEEQVKVAVQQAAEQVAPKVPGQADSGLGAVGEQVEAAGPLGGTSHRQC